MPINYYAIAADRSIGCC